MGVLWRSGGRRTAISRSLLHGLRPVRQLGERVSRSHMLADVAPINGLLGIVFGEIDR
jgi:NADH:ubiquinone oxidoreductase subunit D